MLRLPEFDHPDSAWNRAVDTSAHCDPFCCRTEWQLSFHETFAPNRDLVILEDRGSLVAFAKGKSAPASSRIEPVESSWLFGCPLLGPDAAPLLATLLEQLPQRRAILSGLDLRTKRAKDVFNTFGAHYDIHRIRRTTACRASLAGGLDGYLGRRSAKIRRGIRSAARRANDQGVSYERHAPSSVATSDAVYARMVAVEDASWKGVGDCGMAKPPSVDFYKAMLRRMSASGSGRVIFARHEDTDIGFIFGGLCAKDPVGGIYRGQQFSYSEEWRPSSIGNLLQLEQVRWLAEEGVARYDMGPLMGYKSHWTEDRVVFDALVLDPR